MNNGRKECTFLWFIENYSYCWHKNGEDLTSPEFTADDFEGTAWNLELSPRGDRKEAEGYISLYLNRCQLDDGPVDFSVKDELSVLATDGLSTRLHGEQTFSKGRGYGRKKFVQMDKILLHRKADYLPQDTLSVSCKIWKGEGNVQEVNEFVARTRIGIEEISFLHSIESFSKLEPNEKKTIQIKSPSKKHCALTSSLYFIEDSNEGKVIVEITPSAKNQILAKCKLFLLDRSGKKIECGEADNRLDATRKDIQNLPLSLTRQAILNGKSDYMPEDNLSLSCECVFSTGVEYEKIERTLYGKPFVACSQISNDVQSKGIYNAAQKLSACPSALDDLKAIYNNQMLTDVELKTKTKSFPAHKIWLCARSPVFKTMLTSDMREKNSNHIPIDDLEDDTVQQLLLFLYTDKLEKLSWESAIKLYFAGDKYQVEKLKVICSSFLVDNVSTTSASELLLLADTHSDSDLKEAVEDFILKHEEQVFGSEEWEKLTEVNSQLALKTMLLKYRGGDCEGTG
ncbi:Speckle-type POZ protein [Araneus ventricosus]|uniref:Speckle-type POZ protein n=1 Tax=Araneus ventricosus TaxID=182803 RepID=A0A4Y2SD74_ARAVE|nr:Speckle-type POZ protein [Araneus ventricosus]